MSRKHRNMLRQCNETVSSLYRMREKDGSVPFSWSRARIFAADGRRRAACLFGAPGELLPTKCLNIGYKGPLRGMAHAAVPAVIDLRRGLVYFRKSYS